MTSSQKAPLLLVPFNSPTPKEIDWTRNIDAIGIGCVWLCVVLITSVTWWVEEYTQTLKMSDKSVLEFIGTIINQILIKMDNRNLFDITSKIKTSSTQNKLHKTIKSSSRQTAKTVWPKSLDCLVRTRKEKNAYLVRKYYISDGHCPVGHIGYLIGASVQIFRASSIEPWASCFSEKFEVIFFWVDEKLQRSKIRLQKRKEYLVLPFV